MSVTLIKFGKYKMLLNFAYGLKIVVSTSPFYSGVQVVVVTLNAKGSTYTESIILSDLFVCTQYHESLVVVVYTLFCFVVCYHQHSLLLLFNKYNL